MKKIYCFLLSLVILSFLGFISIMDADAGINTTGSAQTIEYKVTSGDKSVTLTHDYDNMGADSQAVSHIDVSADPSISSNTQLQGQMNVDIQGQTGDDMADVYIVMEDGDTSQVNTQVTTTNSASVSASGSALMGVVSARSENNRHFCPFSGDSFQADGTAGGGQANASSNYNPDNARADIRVVTHDNTNHCCDCFPDDRIYTNQPTNALQQAVNATPDAGPSLVVVDEGEYTGAEIGSKSNLSLYGVWGAGDTTINGRTDGGSTLYVHDSPNFGIQGFTITGGTRPSGEAGKRGHGLDVTNCENIMIEDNTIQNNEGNGIYVADSNNAQITGNTIQNNKWSGINVYGSDDAQITENTVQNNENYGIYVSDSDDAKIKGNTVQNNEDGIQVSESDDAKIKGNTVQNNNCNGIQVYESDNAQITGNNIFENTNHGLNNDSTNPVNAENNWWGPGGTGANAGKPGEDGNNDVSGSVDYDPWSTTPFQIGGAE